jgi:hypothetical protein
LYGAYTAPKNNNYSTPPEAHNEIYSYVPKVIPTSKELDVRIAIAKGKLK